MTLQPIVPDMRIVQRREDGKTEVRKPGSSRASAVVDNEAEGIDRARPSSAGTAAGSGRSTG